MAVENLPAIASATGTPQMGREIPAISRFTQNSLLVGIGQHIFGRIAPQIELQTFAPDQIVFAENDPGDCLYLIETGAIKISKLGRGGQQETLSYLMPNDYFGEMAMVDGGRRSAQATAVGQTILGRIDRSTWDLLLRLAPNAVMTNFTRSVTQRLRQNNQNFIEQMMRSERLSLLGTTVSSIAHDMNNPIGSILGACQIILSKAEDPLICQMSRIIRESVDKMETMTRELLDFSRGDTRLRLQSVSVPELVSQLDSDFAKCRPGCEVQVELGYSGSIQTDRQRMLRAFGNLIRNAREAMRPEGDNLLRFSVKAVGAALQFEISDTGRGIPSEILPKIFEPFMTHGKNNGTGLGLAMTKAVVDAHHGSIAVDTSPAGTTFTIQLPLQPETQS